MLIGVVDFVEDILTGVVVDSVIPVVSRVPDAVGEVVLIGVVEDKLNGVDEGVFSGVVESGGHMWMHGLRSTTSYSVTTRPVVGSILVHVRVLA